jgi:hypothetical protein
MFARHGAWRMARVQGHTKIFKTKVRKVNAVTRRHPKADPLPKISLRNTPKQNS